MEYKIYRTLGFVLGEETFQENDKIFFCFTKDFGKIELLAKGIRKIKAKLKMAMQLFSQVKIEFIRGKNFYILTDACLIKDYSNIKKSFRRAKKMSLFCFLLLCFLGGEEKDENLWKLLEEIFEDFEKESLEKEELVFLYFILNLTSLFGFCPQIQECVLCQKKIKDFLFPHFYFSLKEGGLVCEKCKKKVDDAFEISVHLLKLLKLIFSRNKKVFLKVKVNDKVLKELKRFSQKFLEKTLETKLHLNFESVFL